MRNQTDGFLHYSEVLRLTRWRRTKGHAGRDFRLLYFTSETAQIIFTISFCNFRGLVPWGHCGEASWLSSSRTILLFLTRRKAFYVPGVVGSLRPSVAAMRS